MSRAPKIHTSVNIQSRLVAHWSIGRSCLVKSRDSNPRVVESTTSRHTWNICVKGKRVKGVYHSVILALGRYDFRHQVELSDKYTRKRWTLKIKYPTGQEFLSADQFRMCEENLVIYCCRREPPPYHTPSLPKVFSLFRCASQIGINIQANSLQLREMQVWKGCVYFSIPAIVFAAPYQCTHK